MKKYYFIYYYYIGKSWYPKKDGGKFNNQTETNNKYSKYIIDEQGYTKYGEYKVINWKRISKKEYFKFKDIIG